MAESDSQQEQMTSGERRAAMGLAGIYGFRMLGLFLILPVFALYAEHLPDATPLLAGLAVGVYGLTQAVLQIPFGLLSDHLGRKPVIVGGLLMFAIGSLVAASADNIWTIIFGRALQGSGAIAAAVMALAADLTRESQRTKALGMIGATIGFSFMGALILGPMLSAWIGVSGIFWLTALLAVGGIFIVLLVVPTPSSGRSTRDAVTVPSLFGRVLRDAELRRLDGGIFVLHLLLTALFLSVPLVLRDAGLPAAEHSKLYLPVMLLAIVVMVPFIIIAEKRGRMKPIFLGAVALLLVAQMGLFLSVGSFWGLAVSLALFFIAFNLLEAMLPSMISKIAPVDAKGTAMGVYSTSQFAGAFCGGVLGGWLQQRYGIDSVFLVSAGLTLLWLLFASGMSNPGRYRSELLRLGSLDSQQADAMAQRLSGVAGVVEAVVVAEDGVAYLKVETGQLDREALQQALGSAA